MSAEALPGLSSCCACPELARGRHTVVAGQFPAGAALMLVGEAPGRYEDASGLPFVGPAGRLLDELLEAAGTQRRAVAVTNVVKCRPPANRTPSRIEVARCRDWLERQLTLAAPLVVVTLGATAAAWAFRHSVRLADVRGQVHLLAPQALIATFHPSAALRFGPSGHPRAALGADLAAAVRLAEELTAGELMLGLVGPEYATAVRELSRAAFATLPELDPPSGVFSESVADVAASLTPGVTAFRHRRLVGCLRISRQDALVWLRRVAVHPDERRRGVGRALAEWAHSWARAQGCREARLGVRSSLPENLAFWQRLGYRPVADHGLWVECVREL